MKKEDNIVKKLWNKVNIEQWVKILRVVIICMTFMVISEGIFEIPSIANFFGESLIIGKTGWIVYLIIWLVMWAQVAIIPIPALPILVACNQIPNLIAEGTTLRSLFSLRTVFFILFVTSATVLGAICAYWIGRTVGRKAVKWVAGSEQDYKLWVKKLNGKVGKWTYVSTVLLPVFPDDLISIVVGSIKLNFPFYVITNVTCKFIGLYCMLIFMRLPGLELFFKSSSYGFPIALTFYSLVLVLSFIIKYVLDKKIRKSQPKQIKLETIKETIIEILTKKRLVYKELIIDYDLDLKIKTYLTSKIQIHKYYKVDKENHKEKLRIIIDSEISNYKQIIFDKQYKLNEKYETLLKDINELNI